MEKGLISIIIPTYNRSSFIKNVSVPSVINQGFANWELIIVDDGSTDDTRLVSDYFVRLDRRISYLYKNNGGQGSARNLGIKVAKGDYVLLLDSDDYLLPNMLEELSNYLNRDEQIDFVSCKRWVFNSKKGIFDVNKSNPSCILYRKRLFYDFCFYSEDRKLIGKEDCDLSVSWDIIRKNKEVCLIEKKIEVPLVIYLEHSGQVTNYSDLRKLRNNTHILLNKYLYNKYVAKEELALRSRELGNFDLLLGDVKNGRSNLISSIKFSFNFQALFFLMCSYGGSNFYFFLIFIFKLIREKFFWSVRLFYFILKYNNQYREARLVVAEHFNKIKL